MVSIFSKRHFPCYTHDYNISKIESGIFYLVPNKHGPGKSIVRRPRAPPTSAPLDDDFDAHTQGGTTTRELGPHHHREPPRTSTRGRRKQGSDFVGSSSPVESNFDSVTSMYVGTTMVPKSGPITRRTNPELPPQHASWNKIRPRRGPAGAVAGAEYGIGGEHSQNRPGGGFENYGEFGQYVNEMEQMFGHNGSGEVKLSVTQLGHDAERNENRQIGSGSGRPIGPRSSAALIKVGTGRISRPSRLGSVGRIGEGPKARQDYEMVDRRVVEDGPERTVTISTWREQVANETRTVPEGERDVYYVGVEDYGDENRKTPEVDNHVNRSRAKTPSERRKESGSSGRGSSIRSGGQTNEGGRRPSTEVRYSSLGLREMLYQLTQGHTPWRKTSGQTHHSQSRSEEMIRNLHYPPTISNSPPSQSRKRVSPPRTVTPDREGNTSGQSRRSPLRAPVNGIEGTPVRSSTPVRLLPESPSQKIQTPPRASTPYRSTTPHDRELPPEPESDLEPFHPTQSGSTISTIKSASMVAFENVLASCEPSLLHISPVLANLGIVTEGHLRAIARLTEETRDREVKEEALRQGVTIMEWAILLDKLHAL